MLSDDRNTEGTEKVGKEVELRTCYYLVRVRGVVWMLDFIALFIYALFLFGS